MPMTFLAGSTSGWIFSLITLSSSARLFATTIASADLAVGSEPRSTAQQPPVGTGRVTPARVLAHRGSFCWSWSSTGLSSSAILNSSWAVRPRSFFASSGSWRPGSWIWIWLFALLLDVRLADAPLVDAVADDLLGLLDRLLAEVLEDLSL